MESIVLPGVEIRTAVLFGMFITCLWLESRWPLRKATQPKTKRVTINLLIAVTSAVLLRLIFYPVVIKVSEMVELRSWGLLPWIGASGFLATVLAILALDYTLYIWHQLMHKMPFLWRFHNVHHIDLDLDNSTALRFHFGELALSTFYRSAQIIIIGIGVFDLILFEACVTTFAQFHHSNIRLPIRLERILGRFIITPRMHGIHHSIVREETDSNFGTIFILWDRLHRSFRVDVAQSEIIIGVPSYRDPAEQTFWRSLLIPFKRQRPWRLPDGSNPDRKATSSQNDLLILN
ncbi:MAG: sterol desaturase family protein [Pseudobdellovibrionaceae bacterium]